MSKYFFNSIFISISTVVVLAIVSSMAAFIIARFKFKLNKIIFVFFLIGMMIPMHTILVPITYIIGSLNLKNNLFVLILLYVGFSIPFSVMVLTNFMRGINQSLEEAAKRIDGANYMQIYRHVYYHLLYQQYLQYLYLTF